MSKPWQIIDSEETSEGLLQLSRRNESDFLITIAGRVLMNSHASQSEILLSKLACDALQNKENPKVLVGGLGMGCTLRAALDELSVNSHVVVAELNPVVVKWCRGPLAGLTNSAVDDLRVSVEIGDVAAIIKTSAERGGDDRFDAIILDLYEGPCEAAKARGEYLYGDTALQRCCLALMPGGVLAIWSEDPDKAFEKRLKVAGFSFSRERMKKGSRHIVYLAKI